MSNPYQFSGLTIPELLDRSQLFKQICSDLGSKATPDHVSLVGPKYFGKTVLLNKIAVHFQQHDSTYRIVCFWDLRHDTPATNLAFQAELAKRLDTGLARLGISECREYLIDAGEALPGNIESVIHELETLGIRVLVLLDDFDRLASEPHITKNLWDYLRSLAQCSNLRFVTSSRRRLRDLIPSHEARTSDFWNIFSSTRVLKPIDAEGMDDFLAPMATAGWTFENTARVAINEWTGGVPVLAALICNEIWENQPQGRITKEDIDRICEAVLADRAQDYLKDLWEACPLESQSDLIDLAKNSTHAMGLKSQRQQALVERGYAVLTGSNLKPNCLFMQRFASQGEVRSSDIRELFKDSESDLRSWRALLALKLGQIEGGNNEIRSYIELAIQGLSLGEKAALLTIRSIAQEAINLAWEAEFPGGVIPAPIQVRLTLDKQQGGCGLDHRLLGKINDMNTRRTIMRATAGNQGGEKISTKVTRPLMLLIDSLYNLGNFGQHMSEIPLAKEKPVDIGFCITACWTAIELHKRIAMDLV